MAKLGDNCDECGRIIKSYPIYGSGTCHVCQYEKYVKENMPKILSDIDAFFKKNINEDHDLDSIDFLLVKFVELLPKMKEADVEAINYLLENIKNRYD
jgi:hypothetical protein